MYALPFEIPLEIQNHIPADSLFDIIKDKERSKVYRICHLSSTLYLKRIYAGQLKSEAALCSFLHQFQLGPEVVAVSHDARYDYLLTRALIGQDALTLPDDPEPVIRLFGQAVRRLHSLPITDCPIMNTGESMLDRAVTNYQNGLADAGLLRYLGHDTIDAAYREMCSLSGEPYSRVVIHGDCCLPNLIIHESTATGFIDTGHGGIGDRHYDLFWALWSIQYNLETTGYAACFLQSYGKDSVDLDRIRLFGLISAFNGFRGCDYYERWENPASPSTQP